MLALRLLVLGTGKPTVHGSRIWLVHGSCLRLRLVHRGRDDLGDRDIFLLRISRVHCFAGRLSCTRSRDVLVSTGHGQDKPDGSEQCHE